MITNERKKQCLELWNSGVLRQDIIKQLHMDGRTINAILRENIHPLTLAAQLRQQRHVRAIKASEKHWGVAIDERERAKQILKMWRSGISRDSIRKEVNIGGEELNRVLSRSCTKSELAHAILTNRRRAQRETAAKRFGTLAERKERWKVWLDMRHSGISLVAIAKEFGTTRQTVAHGIKMVQVPELTADERNNAILQQMSERRKARMEARTEREIATNTRFADAVSEQEAVYNQMLNCTDLCEYQRLAHRYSELALKIEYAERSSKVDYVEDRIVCNL